MRALYKVLIVDDEERIRRGLEVILDWAAFGFEVCLSAENGRVGIQRAQEIVPDLIIADLHMPGISGIEMIRQLRNGGYGGQVIILSGVTEFEYAREAIDLRVSSYLLKPVDEVALIDKVTQLFPLIETTTADASVPLVITQMLEHIDKHFDKPLKLNAIARAFHYSTPYLGRVFKQFTGKTFHDYLESVRMDKARELLNQGHKVYVVAKMVGYVNVDYFANIFKTHTGTTPNEYKKNG